MIINCGKHLVKLHTFGMCVELCKNFFGGIMLKGRKNSTIKKMKHMKNYNISSRWYELCVCVCLREHLFDGKLIEHGINFCHSTIYFFVILSSIFFVSIKNDLFFESWPLFSLRCRCFSLFVCIRKIKVFLFFVFLG